MNFVLTEALSDTEYRITLNDIAKYADKKEVIMEYLLATLGFKQIVKIYTEEIFPKLPQDIQLDILDSYDNDLNNFIEIELFHDIFYDFDDAGYFDDELIQDAIDFWCTQNFEKVRDIYDEV